MRTDTLSCSYQMNTTPTDFSRVLLVEQEKFFLAKQAQEPFGEGCRIETMIQTKTAPRLVPAVMTVKKIAADELWLRTTHEEGVIDQRYSFAKREAASHVFGTKPFCAAENNLQFYAGGAVLQILFQSRRQKTLALS